MEDNVSLEMLKSFSEGAGRESVDKIATAIGAFLPFHGIKKVAVSTYVKEIQASSLPPEEKMLAISLAKKKLKHMKNQVDIARIAVNVANEGTDFSNKSKVDDEWLERFMDAAKFVSDEQVQNIWGSILASEFESPGNTPPNVIRILSEITPKYARAFQTICSLNIRIVLLDSKNVEIGETEQIVLPENYEYLSSEGINLSSLNELSALGLIQYSPSSDIVVKFPANVYPTLKLFYYDQVAKITKYDDLQFPVGSVVLTDAGKSISKFTERHKILSHFDSICHFLKDRHISLYILKG